MATYYAYNTLLPLWLLTRWVGAGARGDAGAAALARVGAAAGSGPRAPHPPTHSLPNPPLPAPTHPTHPSLGFCAFSLDVSASAGDRLSLLVTLLLTAAAYKIVVSSALPLVSYLTRLDWYVLVAFGLLVLLTVETAAVSTVADGELRRTLDWALAAGLGGAWGLFTLGFVAAAWVGGRDSHTGLQILEEDARSRSSRVGYKVMAWSSA